jgi:restriction system protein
MPIPDYQTLMLPVLQSAAEGEVKFGDVVKSLARDLALSSEDIEALLPSGQQTVLANRIGWAKTYLTKAGLIASTRRGYFQITDVGLNVLKSNITRIDNSYLTQFEAFQQFRERTNENDTAIRPLDSLPTSTPHELIKTAHQHIEAALAQDILERITAAPPDFFERLIIKLLIGMGYGGSAEDAGRALGRSGDDGVDGVIDQDALGLDRVYVQAKRYSAGNSIGPAAIRDFFGSLDRHKASKGLFVTTSSFSASAKETAEFLSKRIVLIDGKLLTTLMIRFNVGCRIEETLYLKKIDEDFFE